jgi:hypothetical protein
MNLLDLLMISDPWPEGEEVFNLLGGRDQLSLMINARRFQSSKYERRGVVSMYRCGFLYGDKRNLLEIFITVKKDGYYLVRVTSSELRWFRPRRVLFTKLGLYRDIIHEDDLIRRVELATSMSLSF